MLIQFTDPRYYVKGTCNAIAADHYTGDILYQSNKFQTANIQPSVNTDPIRAGLGNGVAAIIPSDSALNVNFTAADFSLWAKAAQVGAGVTYGAPVMACQVVQPAENKLTLDISQGAPVAQLGMTKIQGYVQTVGEGAPIAATGTAYSIDPATGEILEFVPEEGKTYKVWYFVSKATAKKAVISANFAPRSVHFTAQLAVYSNEAASAQNESTRVGWLYVIVPNLMLSGNAGVTGDATTADTTSMTGQAVAFDEKVVSAECEACGGNGGVFAYYVFVLDDGSQAIAGLAVVGGVTTVAAGGTEQLPVRLVMDNGQLVKPGSYASGFTYTLESPPEGTSISESGMITAGTTAGECDCTVAYTDGDKTVSMTSVVSVVAA